MYNFTHLNHHFTTAPMLYFCFSAEPELAQTKLVQDSLTYFTSLT